MKCGRTVPTASQRDHTGASAVKLVVLSATPRWRSTSAARDGNEANLGGVGQTRERRTANDDIIQSNCGLQSRGEREGANEGHRAVLDRHIVRSGQADVDGVYIPEACHGELTRVLVLGGVCNGSITEECGLVRGHRERLGISDGVRSARLSELIVSGAGRGRTASWRAR